MARRDADESGGALDPALTQKKRARRRLVGALVLGLLAAVVLPLVLDSEPRQTITDVQIEIPPRDTPLPPKSADAPVAPPGAPAAAASPAAAPEGPQPPTGKAAPEAARAVEAPAPAEASRAASKSKAPPRPADAAVSASAPEGSAQSPAPQGAARTEATARADARFALQVGAYASAGSARAQADKARKAGVRVYTENVQTAQGTRTRVRAGPFASREAADAARAQLKLIGVDSEVVRL